MAGDSTGITVVGPKSPADVAIGQFMSGITLWSNNRDHYDEERGVAGDLLQIHTEHVSNPDLETVAISLEALAARRSQWRRRQQLAGRIEGWIWGFIVKCIRILQRMRGRIPVGSDSSRAMVRQDKSACAINETVNGLALKKGVFALAVYTVFAGKNLQ